MIARPTNQYRSGNAGEMSPDAKGRVDIKQYYSAGIAYKNIEPVPQSGWRQMGGTRRKGYSRRPLAARAITGPTLYAGPHVGLAVVWTATLAGTVAAVFVSGFSISAGTATFIVEVETAPGVWTAIGTAFNVASTAPVSRLAARPPGAMLTATTIRIRATMSVSATVAISSVSAWHEAGTPQRPRHVALMTDEGVAFTGWVTAGIIDFYTDAGFQGAARLAGVTEIMLSDLGFYAEGRTIGVFHPDLRSQRVFLADTAAGHDWRVDDWPYAPVPQADLGGTYAKTADIWDFTIRWSDNTTMFLAITVDGETTPAVPVKNGGSPVMLDSASGANWTAFAADLQAELVALPSLGAGVTVTSNGSGGTKAWLFSVVFDSALSGVERQFSAIVTSTTNASALAYHPQVGKTDTEPVFSVTQGWPGLATLIQDRLCYARIRAVRAGTALSRVAEYFNLNLSGQDDAAARLDRLRSQTSETILAVKESTFMLVFTDLAAYFVNNRTIERNVPLNFIKASEIGAQPNCHPVDLEGTDYYVGINARGLPGRADGGQQLLSIVYDDVSLKYNASPVSLLASHLVQKILRTARQKPTNDLDAAKGWMMRADGRLIAAQMIVNQDIMGVCEWVAAGGGLVREIGMDGRNNLWMAVQRGDAMSIEIYDVALFLQDAVNVVPDLAGVVTGLSMFEGATVWAVASGYVLGPFEVAGGAIDLEDAYPSAIVGRWQAPRYETMPQVLVTPGDDVILRPGRIHTVQANIIDTTSIAIGANGLPAEDVPLLETGDAVDQPMSGKTKLIEVNGLPGMAEGTTMVITQTRPGTLRVRDFALGAKL